MCPWEEVSSGSSYSAILSTLETNFKEEEEKQRNCKVRMVWYEEDRDLSLYDACLLWRVHLKICICGAFSSLLWEATSTLSWPVSLLASSRGLSMEEADGYSTEWQPSRFSY